MAYKLMWIVVDAIIGYLGNCQRNNMWKQTGSIILVVFLINFTCGLERWHKSQGVASLDCPFDDDPDDPTVLPYQGDCTKFIKCSYGLAYTLSCPLGLHWSVRSKGCEAPRVAACDPNLTTPRPHIGGDGCTFAYKPHPTDCNKAVQCVNGIEYDLECPDGARWDRTVNKCSFGNVVC